jgi:hypothetical protein
VAAVVAILVAGALAAVTARYLDGRYGPMRAGSFGGPYSLQDFVANRDGSSRIAARGPDGTARLMASLSNDGSHAVEVTAIDTDDVVTGVRWSVLRTVPGGFISGTDTPWQDFPAVIPAHTTIRLLITIHRPAYCRDKQFAANGGDVYSGSHRVHWKSLLSRHVTTVEDQLTGIRFC